MISRGTFDLRLAALAKVPISQEKDLCENLSLADLRSLWPPDAAAKIAVSANRLWLVSL
jgi:hypothetical protein